jgi:membrane protease YdiL (CAAX protease family)
MSMPGSPASQRVPWTLRDAAAGVVVLVLLTVGMSLGLGSFIRFADDGLTGEGLLLLVATFGALSGSIAITRVAGASPTWLARVALVTLLAIAAAVALSSGEGVDRDLFAIPIQLVLTLVVVAVDIAVVVAFTVQKYGTPFASLGFVPPVGQHRVLGAFGIWLSGLAVIGLVTLALEQLGVEIPTPPDNASDALDSFGDQLVPAIIAVAIFVPIAEELFFRGFVLPALRTRFGVIASVGASAMLFAVFHVDPGLYFPTFVLGAALGAIRVWTGSLWPSIMVHMTQNALALGLAYSAIEL